jgi:hypothetical protein
MFSEMSEETAADAEPSEAAAAARRPRRAHLAA